MTDKVPEKQQKQPSNEPTIIEQKITKPNGQSIIRKYSKGKVLGRGGFAKCYQITNLENKKILAAKIITKASLNRSKAKQKLISEIKIHKSLQHDNIVHFQHVFQDHENVYIILEICTNQTLNELIKRRKRLVQVQVQCYLLQIVSSLKYLHKQKVIHRDLKLGNLFLNENMEIKLGDFGLATKLEYDGQRKKTICGTPNYIAPQILEGKGHSYQVDVWSVGVIIYTQLIGKPPFQTPDVKSTYKKIRAGQFSFPEHVTISDNARDLISKILQLDPSKRPTLDQIMQHPFMTSNQIPKSLPRSTLACPPSKGYVQQFTAMVPSGSITSKPSEQFKQMRNPSFDRHQLKTASGASRQNEFKSSGSNFRAASKDQLKPSSSMKGMPVSGMNIDNKKQKTNFTLNELHVKKWVDYSTKYGLGYLLSDGSTGVYFNDSTKMILDAAGVNVDYIQRKSGERNDTVSTYPISDCPKQRQFHKKITLLQHFRNYLKADSKDQVLSVTYERKQGAPCYVKKWMKTKHAIMFRLSNKIVQVDFTDKTVIVLSSQQKLVSYINAKGQKNQYPLATALDSKNADMAKRLKYTKQILTHMLNGTTPFVAGQRQPDLRSTNNGT